MADISDCSMEILAFPSSVEHTPPAVIAFRICEAATSLTRLYVMVRRW
jgi:hypothetical protein